MSGQQLRLHSPSGGFHVDVTLLEHQDRWLAVAKDCGDAVLGWGSSEEEALRMALARFDGVVDELLHLATEVP